MPTIEAYADHPTHPYVRVQANWADLPQVTQAAVYRVDVATGECTPLRPYICYDGWELLLSCGHGTWWDTEAPFDREFYYITTSTEAPCVPSASGTLFLDTFSRELTDSWGSTETGTLSPLPYLLSGGTVPTDYDVNGGKGRMTCTNAGVNRTATIDINRQNFDIYGDFSVSALALTDAFSMRLVGRYVDVNNHYQGGLNFQPDSSILIFMTRILAGVQTTLTITFGFGTYTPGVDWSLRFQGVGTEFKLKVWQGPVEPTLWSHEASDSLQPTINGTRVGILVRREGGNTNVNPVLSTDNFRSFDPCAPCDPVTATTTVCTTSAPTVSDSFGRVIVDGWGTPSIGPAYGSQVGLINQFDVTGTEGTITPTATNVNTYILVDASTPDYEAQITCTTNTVPTGAAIGAYGLAVRVVDANNYYRLVSFVNLVTGNVDLFISRIVAGVSSILGTVSAGITNATDYIVKVSAVGPELKLKAWSVSGTEPPWQLSVFDSTFLSSTQLGPVVRRETGNLTPTVLGFDNFLVTPQPADCEPLTYTIPSDGRFWLKDPVRPCHDRPVPLCQTDAPLTPICGGGNGILFIGMGPEVYPANSLSMRPMNRRRTLSATRPRGDAASALRLQTLTFTDRDDLLQLAAPGTPLLFQGPAEYGISDRYMDVGDVQVSPELPDLRIQVRTETLPYAIQDRPAGPSQGICGARVIDICNEYPTWGDLAATGMTWDDLVAGQATPTSANPDARTWNDVNSDFASWNAVNTGGRTWQGLQEGD